METYKIVIICLVLIDASFIAWLFLTAPEGSEDDKGYRNKK